jgi:hypothetical protein
MAKRRGKLVAAGWGGGVSATRPLDKKELYDERYDGNMDGMDWIWCDGHGFIEKLSLFPCFLSTGSRRCSIFVRFIITLLLFHRKKFFS